jgi:hypothetical protein
VERLPPDPGHHGRADPTINLRTAKALGIEVPISMQMLADEVID